LREKLADLRCDASETTLLLRKERDQVVRLNAEVLRAKLAADRDIQSQVDQNVMKPSGKLDEAERERDFVKDGVEEYKEHLKKSKEMNLALIDFLCAVLGQGIYLECNWDNLKSKQRY
jgi:triphosphoribosyl-dephospho-CoA synthetase